MYARFWKRAFDIVLTLVLLLALGWLVILIVLIYKLLIPGPTFFMQERIGKGEKFFRMFKFRTLKPTGENLEARRFWLGDFLRSTSLDELPQCWNILNGDMALIGPRPLPVEYLPLFSDEQRIRHRVRPGITGWAQVNGRTTIDWTEKFKLDVYYVKNISLFLDLKIVVKTIILLFKFKRDVSLNEKAFRGNG